MSDTTTAATLREACDMQDMIAAAIAEIDECCERNEVAEDEAHHRRRCAELELIVERFTRRAAERFGPLVAAAVAGALAGTLAELTREARGVSKVN